MFVQLMTPPHPAVPPPASVIPNTQSNWVEQGANNLFTYHPLQISAIVETFWSQRYNATSSPFVPWPQGFAAALLGGPGGYSPGYDFSTSPPTALLPQTTPYLSPTQLPGLAPPLGQTLPHDQLGPFDLRLSRREHADLRHLQQGARDLHVQRALGGAEPREPTVLAQRGIFDLRRRNSHDGLDHVRDARAGTRRRTG